MFAILRKRIKKNPYIGQEESGGAYLYKKDGYSINYRITKLSDGRVRIKWLSHKRRLGAYEEKIRVTRKGFFDFWHYQKWLVFFRPWILLFLLVSIFLFYSEVMETQEIKMARLKGAVAFAIGINPKDVQYIGDGRLEISAQRKKTAEGTTEPISYTFNPLGWLFSSEGGFLRRGRGQPYGYVTHPIAVNDKGEVWINKEGSWRHGRFVDRNIEWDIPQGSAKVSGHQISTEGKELQIIDK